MEIEKIEEWVHTWKGRGYKYDIPDEAPDVLEQENKVPSYRRICLAIIKNDCQLQTLGIARAECLLYNEIKRDELFRRGKLKSNNKQIGIFYECI